MPKLDKVQDAQDGQGSFAGALGLAENQLGLAF
jgi:hypothetical protein